MQREREEHELRRCVGLPFADQEQAEAGHERAERRDALGRDAADEPAGAGRDRRHCGKTGRQQRARERQRQRRVPDKEIRDDQQDREAHEVHQDAGEGNRGESAVAEQSDLHDGMRDAAFPAQEGGEARRSRRDQHEPEIVAITEPRQRIDREQQGDDTAGQQQGPGDIEALAAPARRGGQAVQQHERGERDRRAKPEDARPSPAGDKRAADQRPDGRAEREHQREDAERMGAPRLRIKARHNGRRAADDQPGPDAL